MERSVAPRVAQYSSSTNGNSGVCHRHRILVTACNNGVVVTDLLVTQQCSVDHREHTGWSGREPPSLSDMT